MKKLYSSKTYFRMAGGEMHRPHPPGSALARTDSNISYHYSNQPIWLQYDVRQILSQLF